MRKTLPKVAWLQSHELIWIKSILVSLLWAIRNQSAPQVTHIQPQNNDRKAVYSQVAHGKGRMLQKFEEMSTEQDRAGLSAGHDSRDTAGCKIGRVNPTSASQSQGESVSQSQGESLNLNLAHGGCCVNQVTSSLRQCKFSAYVTASILLVL